MIPFKVVCINNRLISVNAAPQLKEGEIYTVIGYDNIIGGYLLKEVEPLPGCCSFREERFRPATDEEANAESSKWSEKLLSELTEEFTELELIEIDRELEEMAREVLKENK